MTPVRRRQRPQAPRGTAGLSLIEIMIALAIGSLLILGLVQVFAASRTAYQLSEGMARTQENARFAMDYLQRDIRMAGHYGCVNDQSHLQTPGALVSHFIPVATAATWGIDFPVAIRGYDATGTAPTNTVDLDSPSAGYTPALPAAIAALPALPGSDIIELRFLGNEGVPVTGIVTTALNTVISVDAARWDTLTQDGVANPTMFGLADCSNADVFRAAAVNAGAGTVTVATPIDRYTAQPAGQTMLFRAESMVYYIAPGATGEPALWRARSTNTGTYPPANREELVEGIENMQLLFGLDRQADLANNPPSGFIDVHQPASAVVNDPVQWRRVGVVQVGLLASSPNQAAASQPDAAARKRLLGVIFDPSAVADTRYRESYEATVALRNRLYGN